MTKLVANAELREDSVGYEISRFNAVKHGILSKYTVLPWEDRSEYDALHADFVEEHCPVGPTEEHLVEELAGIVWRKRRLRLAEAATFRRELKNRMQEFSMDFINSTTAAALVCAGQTVPLGNDALIEAIHGDPNEAVQEIRELPVVCDRADRALAILRDEGAGAYERALKALHPDTRECWVANLEDCAEDPDPEYSANAESLADLEDCAEDPDQEYSANAESLAEWIEKETKRYLEQRLGTLNHLDAIREQAFGEAFIPHRLQNLARYETHLDRKLERMLAMLVKLQELRRAREKEGPSQAKSNEGSSDSPHAA